jgi:hypothetical protein
MPSDTIQRLSAALRFLVTGQASVYLKFTSAISPQTLSEIVLQTREAIIWALKENIKLLFTCHKAGKLRYSSINSIMNSLVLDVPTMAAEPQLKRYCTIFTLDGTIKIDASLFVQYV